MGMPPKPGASSKAWVGRKPGPPAVYRPQSVSSAQSKLMAGVGTAQRAAPATAQKPGFMRGPAVPATNNRMVGSVPNSTAPATAGSPRVPVIRPGAAAQAKMPAAFLNRPVVQRTLDDLNPRKGILVPTLSPIRWDSIPNNIPHARLPFEDTMELNPLGRVPIYSVSSVPRHTPSIDDPIALDRRLREQERLRRGEQQLTHNRKCAYIARYFIDAVAKFGCKAYLAGGAAIALHGGRRPIADVDLRTDAQAGVITFLKDGGITLCDSINQLLLPKARLQLNVTISPFRAIGEDGVTIGTDNWDGIEVSLTIHQGFPHRELVSAEGGLPTLDLVDLLRDKLKTVISRTKTGDSSVKKVAQDLFDVLSVMRMLPPEVTRDIATLIDQFRHRSPQYAIANLEQFELPKHFEGEVMAVRMLDRFLYTVDAHICKGERRQKLAALMYAHDPELAQGLRRLNRLQVRHVRPSAVPGWTYEEYWEKVRLILLYKCRAIAVEARGEIVRHIIEYADDLDLRPWFSKWNSPPYPIPTRYMKPQPRVLALPMSSPSSGSSLVSPAALELLRGAPSLKNEEKVLYILCKSGGFRALQNSGDESEVNLAFGLSKNQFGKAFKELRKAGFVEPSEKGLHLTQKGGEYIKSKYPGW